MDKPLSDSWFAQKRGSGLGGPRVGHLINNPFATLAKYILVFICSRSHNWVLTTTQFKIPAGESGFQSGYVGPQNWFFYDTCCPWIPPSRKGAPKERLGPQEDQLTASHTHPGVPQVGVQEGRSRAEVGKVDSPAGHSSSPVSIGICGKEIAEDLSPATQGC